MKAGYLKFVQWNAEDGVYVGYCPDLFIGGVCHGKDERRVYAELCSLVTNEIEDLRRQRQNIPVPRALVALAVSI
jgi:predicted RNase H-like HicB family nuclease